MPEFYLSFEKKSQIEDFSQLEQKLIQQAQEASSMAYAPYSNFWVGAALLLSNEQIVWGNNQENAAYPSGLCAERVAFFTANSQLPNEKIIAVAIVARRAKTEQFTPVSPCGACRQVMLEYQNKQKQPIKVIFQAKDHSYCVLPNIASLLPFQFDDSTL